MKRYKSILSSFLIATMAFSSCTELEDENYSQIITSQFDPQGDDLGALVGAAYVSWRPLMIGRSNNSIYRTNEISSDELVIPARPNGWVDGGMYRRVHEHRWTADDANSSEIWNRAYAGITACNRIIFQIESGSLPITDAKAIETTLAELKVLRASYYYALCDFFGNVPIITRFDVPDGFLPEQSSRQEVFNFIVKEITDNLPLLSDQNDLSTYGKFNQWAAHGLLAKLYLNAEVYTGTPAWDKCIEHANAIINSGAGFMLEPVQANVFRTNNEGSKEIVFAIPFDEKYTPDWENAWTLHMETLQPANQATYNFQGSPWGGICAVPQFVDTFDPDDQRLKSTWIQGQQFTSTGAILNGTMGAYAGRPLIYINELPGVDLSEEGHGFRIGKYEFAQGALVGLSNDFPMIRYADVLMMKAESLLRSGQADAAAELVTQVRQRSFAANPTKATVTGAQLQQGSTYDYGLRNHQRSTTEGGANVQYGRFLDELGWEFAAEGRRRQDMIRFGVFTTKSWLSHVPNGDYRKLLPIPRVQLERNPNLSQNPGY
ncbi:RagB/SusD family nutrient uptake outer membrane protein [Pontibacter sp. 13R65]|uniref:RagB/SusD family nutrient uptake outer membrane protein n=1 Tax=Pontibacter sp. 13R65 TaxID=3127458 RepID=UPI00301E181C